METEIHSTAIVERGAELGMGVKVGPFCMVGPDVKMGDRCTLISHTNIIGHTSIGQENEFHPFCSIGVCPQDLNYGGEKTLVEIGDKNIFREYVSIHRGTATGRKITTIGSENLLMSYVHLGHDVVLGNKGIIVNSVNVAGHVKIKDHVIIGGSSAISQMITIGESAYIGGASVIIRDIPPFCTAYGNRVRLTGINIIGLRRRGHSKQVISELVNFYRTMESSALSPPKLCQQ